MNIENLFAGVLAGKKNFISCKRLQRKCVAFGETIT